MKRATAVIFAAACVTIPVMYHRGDDAPFLSSVIQVTAEQNLRKTRRTKTSKKTSKSKKISAQISGLEFEPYDTGIYIIIVAYYYDTGIFLKRNPQIFWKTTFSVKKKIESFSKTIFQGLKSIMRGRPQPSIIPANPQTFLRKTNPAKMPTTLLPEPEAGMVGYYSNRDVLQDYHDSESTLHYLLLLIESAKN
jgi:hypothetical protein